MNNIKIIQGTLNAEKKKIAIVAAKFNNTIVANLIEGATDCLIQHGVLENDIVIYRCSGSYELPLVVQEVAKSKKFDGIVALGTLIRGGTIHFDLIASQVCNGLATVTMEIAIPIGFGVLTTETTEQAMERSGIKLGNKGWEAALAVLDTISLLKKI